MSAHKRKCWDCGNVALHEDSVVPHVLCKQCGSQDTRKIKEQPPPDRQVVFESEWGKVYAPDEQGNMATMGAGHSLCCDLAREILRLRESSELHGGPISSERWTLDELIVQLEKWKRVASGQTCVSFECLCYGASSLWHQTHRDNHRKIDRQPEELSRWVLDNVGGVSADFPKQVLGILKKQKTEIEKLRSESAKAIKALLELIAEKQQEIITEQMGTRNKMTETAKMQVGLLEVLKCQVGQLAKENLLTNPPAPEQINSATAVIRAARKLVFDSATSQLPPTMAQLSVLGDAVTKHAASHSRPIQELIDESQGIET